jgi:hypothetical protein
MSTKTGFLVVDSLTTSMSKVVVGDNPNVGGKMQIDLDEVVDQYYAAHAKQCKASGLKASTNKAQAKVVLADVIAKLQAMGITLPVILRFVGSILMMISQGTPAAAIVASVLTELGGLVKPTPA